MKKYILIFAVIVSFVTPMAVTPSRAVESVDNNVTRQIEVYLQSLTTLKSGFIQTTYDGQQTKGTFYLNRPGKLRFEYDHPIKDFIVADGVFIYFYDSEMEQQSNAPIGSTLADFILRENPKLSGDIKVTEITDKKNFLMVTVTQASDPGAGSLILGFDKNPFRLRGWRILDAQGLMTEIELTDIKTDISLPNKLFWYHDPKKNKPQYN